MKSAWALMSISDFGFLGRKAADSDTLIKVLNQDGQDERILQDGNMPSLVDGDTDHG